MCTSCMAENHQNYCKCLNLVSPFNSFHQYIQGFIMTIPPITHCPSTQSHILVSRHSSFHILCTSCKTCLKHGMNENIVIGQEAYQRLQPIRMCPENVLAFQRLCLLPDMTSDVIACHKTLVFRLCTEPHRFLQNPHTVF